MAAMNMNHEQFRNLMEDGNEQVQTTQNGFTFAYTPNEVCTFRIVI